MSEVAGSDGIASDAMGALLLDSLRRRMHAMFSLYYDAVATMNIDHVNHFEREGVLPIAFSLFHIVNMVDASFMMISGAAPVWDDTWVERVNPAIPNHGKEKTVGEMIDQRIGNYEEFQVYMRTVFDRVEAWLEQLDPNELTRLIIARPLPEQVANTYSARVAGPEGITLLDATECWIYQHGLRHMGEIELSRGLVGLNGMTS
ncbi:MAG: hypothetical protein WCI26_12955 [Acidimicrobiales bacterium]|jgi:hypothetical protein